MENDKKDNLDKYENTADGSVSLGNGSDASLDEPNKKMRKICDQNKHELCELKLNPILEQQEFTQNLGENWSKKKTAVDYKNHTTGAEIYLEPFQLGLLPELLQSKENCRLLVDEMVHKVHWSRKQMDLYEFYQSTDLSNMSDCKMLTQFLQILRRQVRPWLEQVTNLKLDYVSASCSMYTCGDYLLVHDDLLKDRQVAFVYYLSPWEGAEHWTEDQGGCLEIFNSDDRCLPHFPVRRKIAPKNNQLVFFKVGSRSFHQVGEITTFDYPRLTINGWFHGATNDDLFTDTLRPFTKLDFKAPESRTERLEELFNEIYLKANTRINIQKRIEDNSEICLYEFLKRETFQQSLDALLTDTTLKWHRQGPANAQNYEVLELESANGILAKLIRAFSSVEMFDLLRDYTDLDLAGPNASEPSCSLELQRWSHGNYTVLGDGAICDENTLDLVYYLNAADGAGVITYLSPEQEGDDNKGVSATSKLRKQSQSSTADDSPSETYEDDDNDKNEDNIDNDDDDDESVLLTITPIDNSLNIVYRCVGTTKFTKYVSKNTPMDKGPVFVLSCSYKE